MRKLILFSISLGLMLTACSKVGETNPSGEQSIETVGSESGAKVLLRLKPKVGDTQKMMVIMNMNLEDSDEMKVNMTSNLDMSVVKKEDSIYTYEMRYRTIKMNMQTGAMELEYDSEAKEQNPMSSLMGAQMKGLLENPVWMKMDEMGRVIEFHLPKNFSAEQTGDLGSVSVPMPKEPVGAGDSWTAQRPMQGLGGNMDMKMTVEKITVDDVTISVSGVLNKADGQKIGDLNGQYKLDRKTGLTKDGAMNIKTDQMGKVMNMKIEFKSA